MQVGSQLNPSSFFRFRFNEVFKNGLQDGELVIQRDSFSSRKEAWVCRRLYIVGCPRSGTTLLQCILGAHSQIATFPESHFFEDYDAVWPLSALGFRSRKIPRKLERFLQKAGRDELIALMPRGPISLFRKPYADGFIRVTDRLTLDAGKNVWLEKTPTHLKSISTIDSLAKPILCLHVVRDGRHAIASLYESFTQYWHDADFQSVPEEKRVDYCIDFWTECMEHHFRHMDNPRHHFLSYDELTLQPRIMIQNLCQFIGISFEEGMLTRYPRVAESVVLKHEVWKENAKGPIQRRCSKFYTAFSRREQRRVETRVVECCSRLLARIRKIESSERTRGFFKTLELGLLER